MGVQREREREIENGIYTAEIGLQSCMLGKLHELALF